MDGERFRFSGGDEKLFSIREAARICGISRTTLLRLEEAGFLVPAIRYPTVARGAARLRVSVSASSGDSDLQALAETIARHCRDVGAGRCF